MTLGEILRDLLAEKDITQKQLADSLNMGVSTLSNYVQNNREPDFGTLKRLADYFDVTTDYLLNHRTKYSVSYSEDELLRVFRTLTKDQQELFIKQGKLLVTHYKKKKSDPDLKVSDNKRTGYQKK